MSEFNRNDLNTFLDAFTIPALVIDNEDSVLSYNNDFKYYFQRIALELPISEIFESETFEIIKSVVEKVKYTQKQITDYLEIGFNGTKKNRYKVVFSTLTVNSEKVVLITFNPSGLSASETNKAVLNTFDSEEVNGKLNSEVFEIIEKIKSLYPFTIIAKEKILDLINNYKGYFWILDSDKRIIVVNDMFSHAVGIKHSQLEGKSIFTLIPNYLFEYYKTLFILIENSLKCIQSEGIPVHGMSSNELQDSYTIPIVDLENHVQGFIGIGYLKSKGVAEISGRFIYEDFPEFCFSMDSSGSVLEINKIFREYLLSKHSSNPLDEDSKEYFNLEFIDEMKKLCQNYSNPIELNNQFPLKNNGSGKCYKVKLFKNTVSTKENNFIIFIEQEVLAEDIEGLLKKRGKMFDVIIKNNPEPIFVYTVDNLRFVEVNSSAENLYGYTRDEFLRMDLTDLYTPEDIQTLLNDSKQNTGKNYTGPFKHKKRDRTVIHVEIFKEHFLYEGKEAHFIIVKDISGRMNIERDLQLFRSISTYSNDLVFIIDTAGFISFCNDSVGKELLLSNNDILGTSIISFLTDDDRAKLNSLIITKQPKNQKISVSFLTAAKEKLESEVDILPFTNVNNDVDTFAVIAKPIRKPAVIEKIVKIEKPADYSGASVSSDFLSAVFHEILTPIHVILGFVQEIKDSVNVDNPEIEDALSIISQNRVHLSDVMDSISEYIQNIEIKTPISLSKFRIVDLINSLEDEISDDQVLKNRNLLLTKANRSLEVVSDKKLLKSTLWNILKTISRISSSTEIYISFYQFDEENLIITFRDGDSITPKLLKVLNSVIQNNDSNAVKEFGLSKFSALLCQNNCKKLEISAEVVKKSGYDFEFGLLVPFEMVDKNQISEKEINRDDDNKNLSKRTKKIFDIDEDQTKHNTNRIVNKNISLDQIENDYVSIRKKKENVLDDQSSINERNKRLNLSQLTCLYMEDQVDSQVLFKVQMKELKEIKFALGFEDAEPLLKTVKFDFIVMDINLQGEYNGLDALKMIHRMPGLEYIPIIAATAYILPGDKEKFIAAGFTDFVSKPIFREKIIESLEKIFLK